MTNIKNYLNLLQIGIGFHHEGMFPILKELVEILFQQGLIKVLFTTENFLLSNNKIKTVVITSLIKSDGENKRYLEGGEYNKISRKAGRKGIDQNGNVIIMVDKDIDEKICEKIIKGKPAPFISSFSLSYNKIANLIKNKELKTDYILSKSFCLFQQETSLSILRKKLAKLYNEYLLNGFNDDELEVNIKDLYEIKEALKNLNNELRTKIFVPQYLSQYLCFGRVVKLEKIGYGMVISYEIIKNQANRKSNINIKTEVDFNNKNNFPYKDDYSSYLKHIGLDEYFISLLNNKDINIDNNNNENNNEFKINTKFLKKINFINDTLNKRNKSKDKISLLKNRNPNNSTINDQDMIINCLVSLKNNPEQKDYLYPGNFEENPNNFYGIIAFNKRRIEEICDIKIKKIDNLQEQDLIDAYGNKLKELKVKTKDKLPVLDINIKEPEINKLKDEISIMKNKYNTLVEENINKDIDLSEDDINIYIETNIQKYIDNKKLEEEIEKILTKLKKYKNFVLNEELNKMKSVMNRLDLLNNDEELTPKGLLLCDILGLDALLISELISSGFFKDMKAEEIGASIYCCLSKENTEKKIRKESKDNDLKDEKGIIIYKDEYKIENIFEEIKNKVNYIANILENYEIKNESEKIKYIESFNDNYMKPLYNWIDGETFDELIKEYDTLYEGNLISIIRKLEKFLKSIETNDTFITENDLKTKFDELHKKIKRGLPFASSLYLTKN